MSKNYLVVFTGAGISAESGIKTFRDSGGLWEEHRVEDVATFEGWERDQEMVLNFYNQRRRQVMDAQPNLAHRMIAKLQEKFEVQVITQNIDDLHERAGSKNVLHLHGEIMKSRSTADASLIYPMKSDVLRTGDLCEMGFQLRPHVVWFGEMVSEMDNAIRLASNADLFVVIGTSLNVYPAAGIVNYVSREVPKWIIDPGTFNLDYIYNIRHINSSAVEGVKILEKELGKFS